MCTQIIPEDTCHFQCILQRLNSLYNDITVHCIKVLKYNFNFVCIATSSVHLAKSEFQRFTCYQSHFISN